MLRLAMLFCQRMTISHQPRSSQKKTRRVNVGEQLEGTAHILTCKGNVVFDLV